MNYINNSEPYTDHHLNDDPNELLEELSMTVADSARRGTQTGAPTIMHEVPTGTELRIAEYIREINDAKENKDVELIKVAVSTLGLCYLT